MLAELAETTTNDDGDDGGSHNGTSNVYDEDERERRPRGAVRNVMHARAQAETGHDRGRRGVQVVQRRKVEAGAGQQGSATGDTLNPRRMGQDADNPETNFTGRHQQQQWPLRGQ